MSEETVVSRSSLRKQPREQFVEQPRFRPEVQGLRSLAVLLVVLYHVWFGKVSGGVDVFLFISAFLLSLSSLKKINSRQPLYVLRYWLHVFQRLVPAAVVVILATLGASYFLLARSRWEALLEDAQAALFYFMNWRLAFSSVDYYAQDDAAKTPFQHFWSLSLQGQVFILWPLLFTLLAFLVWIFRGRVTALALLIFGTVFAASLAFSIYETEHNQAFAYFDTRTRLWEFAAGTLLALLILKWKAPRPLRLIMGWVGIIGLVTCGWILPVETGFPGYLAAWPVLSGAMVIAAGQTDSKLGADRFLSMAPLQKMGAISYSLYLVHWPVLIIYSAASGLEKVGFMDGLGLITLSLILAWLLHHLVEKPLRNWDKALSRLSLPLPRRGARLPLGWVPALLTLAVFMGSTFGGVNYLQQQEQARQEKLVWLEERAGTDDFPGALAAGQEREYTYDPIPYGAYRPATALPGFCADDARFEGSGVADPENGRYCWMASYGQSEDAPLMVLVGDSHAHHALPIANALAEQQGAQLVAMIRPGCRFSLPEDSFAAGNSNANADCADYNAAALAQIEKLDPAAVMVISTRAQADSADEVFVSGLREVAQQLTARGTRVIALRDNPRATEDTFQCYQENLNDYTHCGRPLDQSLAPTNPAQEFLADIIGTYEVDLTEAYCPDGFCPAVVGNIAVKIDSNHISRQFALSTVPLVEQQLAERGFSLTEPLVIPEEVLPAPEALQDPVIGSL